ncbi:MAG: hypothetical protein GX676_08295, partial [Bacilli bacterium]|nr:hypothetical protein [Bacilli bacterium]
SRKDTFAANVNSYISAAKTDALSEWATKGTGVTVIYSVKGGVVKTVDDDEDDDIIEVVENFGIDVFTEGQITIVVNKEGKITKITLITPFQSENYKLNKDPNTPIYIFDEETNKVTTDILPFTRDDIEKVGYTESAKG